jgi:hypothetical protein
MSVHRFPKWLFEGPFTVDFRPTDNLKFAVTLPRNSFPGDVTEYTGLGNSVAEAAKRARKHREDRKR